MTSPPQDNANAFDASPGRVAHLVQDLTSRYDDLLEFLLEFTHRQAQWDQRQQQLVDFQRRAIEQLRSTSFELVERHQQLQSAYPVLRNGDSASHVGQEDHSGGTARSASSSDDLPEEQWPRSLRDKAAKLDEYEEELKQRIFEQKQLTQLTRLQRRKLAQQLRAQRAELERFEKNRTHDAPQAAPLPDLTQFFEQFQKDLDEERVVSRRSLDALQNTLDQTQEEKKSLQQQLKERIGDIDELKRLVVELEREGRSRHEESTHVDEEQLHRLEDARREVEQRAQELEQLEQKTRLQRQKIAQTLRAQKAEQQRFIEREHEEERPTVEATMASIDPESLQRLQEAVASRLDQQMELIEQRLSIPAPPDNSASGEELAEATAAIQQLRDDVLEQLTTKHDAIVARLSETPDETDQVSDWMNELREQIVAHQEKAETSLASLEERLASLGDVNLDDSRDELNELRKHLRSTEADVTRLMDENTELAQQLEEARHAIEEVSVRDEEPVAKKDSARNSNADLERLESELEQALEQNRTLKKQLAESGRNASSSVTDGMDWESAKRRMLAELEAFDDDEPEEKKERLSIEDVINETDRIIAEKDEEIVELKHLLSHQSESIGEVAVGAAAIAELMDHDELIQQERESLRQLQEEWKEKLRTTEVELSLERARLARERAELEERITQLTSGDDEPERGGKSAGNNRGKWLERLGLRDEEK